jgi:hypothetical protein
MTGLRRHVGRVLIPGAAFREVDRVEAGRVQADLADRAQGDQSVWAGARAGRTGEPVVAGSAFGSPGHANDNEGSRGIRLVVVIGLINGSMPRRAERLIRAAWPSSQAATRHGQVPSTVSELGQFGVRCCDSFLLRAEIDENGDLVFDTDDHAKAVLVVSHPVLHGKLLERHGRSGWDVEGTSGQVAPGHGARWLHCY